MALPALPSDTLGSGRFLWIGTGRGAWSIKAASTAAALLFHHDKLFFVYVVVLPDFETEWPIFVGWKRPTRVVDLNKRLKFLSMLQETTSGNGFI